MDYIYSREEKELITQELKNELNGSFDGGLKNIISNCPECGKKNKFGVYIGKETERKTLFSANCFSCGKRFSGLESLATYLGRLDLIQTQTSDIASELDVNAIFKLDNGEDEIDDSLEEIELPDGFKRVFFDRYLNSRQFEPDDYDYFPVGVSKDFKFKDYIIFPIIDNGRVVGYVSRNKKSKRQIDAHNRKASRRGGYKILRYRNSTENDFVKLLYNYDSVIEDETQTVILVEGIFDCIGITRELELSYPPRRTQVLRFVKKVSNVHIYKLQSKGVKNVVIGYDADFVEMIKQTAEQLETYFNVFIAPPPNPDVDYGDMDFWDFWESYVDKLMTFREFKLGKLQE